MERKALSIVRASKCENVDDPLQHPLSFRKRHKRLSEGAPFVRMYSMSYTYSEILGTGAFSCGKPWAQPDHTY